VTERFRDVIAKIQSKRSQHDEILSPSKAKKFASWPNLVAAAAPHPSQLVVAFAIASTTTITAPHQRLVHPFPTSEP
jgi:hypothetical protein